jgi:hypothetical protein
VVKVNVPERGPDPPPRRQVGELFLNARRLLVWPLARTSVKKASRKNHPYHHESRRLGVRGRAADTLKEKATDEMGGLVEGRTLSLQNGKTAPAATAQSCPARLCVAGSTPTNPAVGGGIGGHGELGLLLLVTWGP